MDYACFGEQIGKITRPLLIVRMIILKVIKLINIAVVL